MKYFWVFLVVSLVLGMSVDAKSSRKKGKHKHRKGADMSEKYYNYISEVGPPNGPFCNGFFIDSTSYLALSKCLDSFESDIVVRLYTSPKQLSVYKATVRQTLGFDSSLSILDVANVESNVKYFYPSNKSLSEDVFLAQTYYRYTYNETFKVSMFDGTLISNEACASKLNMTIPSSVVCLNLFSKPTNFYEDFENVGSPLTYTEGDKEYFFAIYTNSNYENLEGIEVFSRIPDLSKDFAKKPN